MPTHSLLILGVAAAFSGRALAAPACVQDGQCTTANASCCGHSNYTDTLCGYTGVGAGCCRAVCAKVTSLVLAKLHNGMDCAAIRKQEGADEGVDRGFCDVLYEGKNYSCNMVCQNTMSHLLGPTCAMAANSTARTSNPTQICAASGPCGTGTKCGCIRDGRCLQPGQDPTMCCDKNGASRTTSCRFGHERQGQQCGPAHAGARFECVDNKCQAVKNGGASRAACEDICG
jgi:hypothetical protein